LNTDLTVLVGVNGAGKTNIMTAINLLAIMGNTHFTMLPVDKETEIIVIFTESDWTVELHINTIAEFQPEFSWRMADIVDQCVKVPLYFIQSDKVEENSRAVKNYFNVLNMDISGEKIDIFTLRMIKIKAFIESIHYYSAVQFSDVTKVDPLIKNTPGKSPQEMFLSDLFDMRNKFPEKYAGYKDLVGPTGIHLVDDILFKGYIEFVDSFTPENLSKENKDTDIWMPLIEMGGKQLKFNQLSEGTFKTMALLFYITAYDNGLLLLEEPEISIHHKLLRDVIEIIQNESEHKQILFSTHSDYVVDILKPQDIVFIENSRNGTKTRSLPEELAKGNYKGLKAYLQNQGSLGEYWIGGGFEDE
jgi:ABC-type lipoprotein export system ATPase subunit